MLLSSVFMFIGITYAINVTKHHTFKSSLLDLGVFIQAIWSYGEYGTPMTSINPPYIPGNWLGFHFSPLVLILSPLCDFFSPDKCLLFLNSFFISIAALPFFMTVKRLGMDEAYALLFSLLYLANPFVVNGAVFDFHEIAMAAPLMSLALWAVVAKRFPVLLLCMGFLLLCKEHFGLSVAGFGILWWWVHHDGKRGLVLVVTGITFFAVTMVYLMPLLNHSGSHPMLTAENNHLKRYGWVNLPLPEMIKSLFNLATNSATVSFLILFLMPICLMPLLGMIFLIPGIPDMAANILSSNPMPKSPFSYHSATLIPFMIVASCHAIKKHTINDPALLKRICMLSLILTLVSCYATFPFGLPKSADIWQVSGFKMRQPEMIEEIQDRIGPDDALCVQANIGAFFSERKEIFPFPKGIGRADTILLYIDYPFDKLDHTPFEAPYAIVTPLEFIHAVKEFLNRDTFGIVYFHKGWLIARRDAAATISPETVLNRLEQIGGK